MDLHTPNDLGITGSVRLHPRQVVSQYVEPSFRMTVPDQR